MIETKPIGASLLPRLALRRAAELMTRLQDEALLLLVLAGYVTVLLLQLNRGLTGDGWLALVGGREIVQHGLPHHNTWTIVDAGKSWVDQQWLAQLCLYGLVALGGFRLALLCNVLVGFAAFAGAMLVARRSGATTRTTVWISIAAFIPIWLVSGNMRPQSFVLPLFVAILWLLARDARAPSPRVYVVLPILILWGNLHGSVALAAGLVAIHGLIIVVRSFRARPIRPWALRASLLTLGPWLCLLVSPYNFSLLDYYRLMFINPPFRPFVTEWAPTHLSAVTVPFYLLAFGAIWVMGRAGNRFTALEKAILIVTLILSFVAIRNVIWFALAALCFVPWGLEPALRHQRARAASHFNRILAVAAGVVTVAAFVPAIARPASWLTDQFPPQAAQQVAAAAGRSGTVFSDEVFADWLLWSEPSLEGRVGFDVRFELLSAPQIQTLLSVDYGTGDWRKAAEGYRVLVLGAADAPRGEIAALQRDPGGRLLYRGTRVVVVEHTPRTHPH